MAFKFVSATSIALVALLSNSMSPNLVQASFQTAGQGVVRIELERKLVNHLGSERLQIADTVDVDKMKQFDKSGDALGKKNTLIDLDENNF